MQNELKDIMIMNDKRKSRVTEFYSTLNEIQSDGVVFDNLFEKKFVEEKVEPPLGEMADDPTGDPSQPPNGENESPAEAGTGAETETKTTEIVLVPTGEGKEGGSSPTTVAADQPVFWYCIGSASWDQQVLESEVIQKRYQAAAASVSAMISDTKIPKESDLKENEPLSKMLDVLKLLNSMHTFAETMMKAISTISEFEEQFVTTPPPLGMPQNIVMHLYRGVPYETEFENEIKALDEEWGKVEKATDEVDKNTKGDGAKMKEEAERLLQNQEKTNASVENVKEGVIKILDLLEMTNKTMSMSLSEQAALRAKNVRERIFGAVVACGKPDEKSASLAFLRDVCEEYRGKADVLDWIHPKVGWTATFYACTYNYSECVEILGQCKANIDLRLPPFEGDATTEGWSCLTISASEMSTDCIASLLKLGADVNLPHSKTGQTALHHAVLNGDMVTVNTILATAAPGSVNLNLSCSKGMSPIYTGLELLASQSENTLKQRPGVLLCISALMDAGAIVQPDAFAFAARKARCNAALKLMISHPKFDKNLVNEYVEGHGTILYCAVEGRNYEGLESLIAAGADANKIPSKSKSSPVIFAIGCNDVRAVEILLKQPTLNLEHETLKSDGKSCLFLAVERNLLKILSLLVDKLAEGDAAKRKRLINYADKEGRTPLLLACQLGLVQHVEKLVSTVGCDVDRADNQGKTPAFTATEKGFYNVLMALIKANCDLKRPCRTGDTPLSWIRTKTSDYRFAEDPGEYEFDEEAENEDERYMQIRSLLEKNAAPQAVNCTCLIS